MKNGIHGETIKQVLFTIMDRLDLVSRPSVNKVKRETLTIQGYLNLGFHPFMNCTVRVFSFPCGVNDMQTVLILHSFSLITFLYRSVHYQPTTQVIGRAV